MGHALLVPPFMRPTRWVGSGVHVLRIPWPVSRHFQQDMLCRLTFAQRVGDGLPYRDGAAHRLQGGLALLPDDEIRLRPI
jgi:hypothetical protein